MSQIPPLFQESQKLDKSELVDSLANKGPRIHKDMLIDQDFNPETRNLKTFVKHCEQVEATDNIAGAKFFASDKDSATKRKKKRLKSKDKNGKKRQQIRLFGLSCHSWQSYAHTK